MLNSVTGSFIRCHIHRGQQKVLLPYFSFAIINFNTLLWMFISIKYVVLDNHQLNRDVNLTVSILNIILMTNMIYL